MPIDNYFFSEKKSARAQLFKEFCESTSLHGWFFFQQSQKEKKNFGASFFWLLIILTSMLATVFVMGTTIHGKYRAGYIIKIFIFSMLKKTCYKLIDITDGKMSRTPSVPNSALHYCLDKAQYFGQEFSLNATLL